MKRKFLTFIMIAAAFCVFASVSVNAETYPFTYDSENVTVKLDSGSSKADYFYTIKFLPLKADPEKSGDAKAAAYLSGLKWYPFYGTAIDVSKLLPAKPAIEGKEVYVAIVSAAKFAGGVALEDIMTVNLPARAEAPKLKKDFELVYDSKDGADNIIVKLLDGANIGQGLQYKVELGTWMDHDFKASSLEIPRSNMPSGGAIELRIKAGEFIFPAKGKTPSITVEKAAASKAAKVKVQSLSRGPKIKLDSGRDSGLMGVKAGQEYRLWKSSAWDVWTALKDESGMLKTLQTTAPQENGLLLVQIRTAASTDGKKPASAPSVLDVTPPSKATVSGNLTGIKGTAITSYDITVTLTGNNEFKSMGTDSDCKTWITGLPAGLSVKPGSTVASGGKTLTLVVSGTPTAAKTESPIAIKIPKTAYMVGGVDAFKEMAINVMTTADPPVQAKMTITEAAAP